MTREGWWLACGLLALLALAFSVRAEATTYQYTGKIQSATGGTAPQSQSAPAEKTATTSYNSYSVFYETHAAACGAVPGWNGGYVDCTGCGLPPGMCTSCTCGGTAHATNGGWRCTNGGTMTTGGSYVQGGASAPTCTTGASCPEGTGQGAGGLCYPMVCPADGGWEPDPGDSTRCRRPERVCPAAGTPGGPPGGTLVPTSVTGSIRFCSPTDGCVYSAAGLFQPTGQTQQLVGPYLSLNEPCGEGYPVLGASGPGTT